MDKLFTIATTIIIYISCIMMIVSGVYSLFVSIYFSPIFFIIISTIGIILIIVAIKLFVTWNKYLGGTSEWI